MIKVALGTVYLLRGSPGYSVEIPLCDLPIEGVDPVCSYGTVSISLGHNEGL